MSRKNATVCGLKLENLEGRSLMAADISLSNDVLNINGTTNNDIISVIEVVGTGNGWDSSVIGYRATVQNRDSGQIVLTKDYGLNEFKTIVMNGDLGNDRLLNQTSKPSVLMGGGGTDTAYGGTGADAYNVQDIQLLNEQLGFDVMLVSSATIRNGILIIPGSWDSNRVDISLIQISDPWSNSTPVSKLKLMYTDRWGNVGATYFDPAQVKYILYMGTSADDTVNNQTAIPSTMYGGAGVDNLSGGSANDLIFGGENVDNLYGNLGADRIFGGNGDDFLSSGVAGDTSVDYLFGEAGADEFSYSYEDILDFSNSQGDIRKGRR